MEGAGIICVEVKGGNVWHDGNTWRQSTANGPKPINPVEQVREACYALRTFVDADQRWQQPWLRWDHAVVLPGAKIAEDFALPDCPRWKVTDKSELTELVPRLRAVLLDKETKNPVLTLAGIEQLRLVLSGRGLTQRDIVAQAQENEDTAQILTEHQAVILDATRLLNRIEVRGGAGRWQDVPRARAGPAAFRSRTASRVGLLLPRPRLVPSAIDIVMVTQTAARLRG